MARDEPELALVMPAYNAAALLSESLPPALEAAGPGGVLVVDPGSDDGTAERPEALGARVLRLARRAGPAEARNEGVRAVEAPVVLFVDADCVVHPDVAHRVRAAFAADPELVSLTGSYDDRPRATNFFSLYMNLRHHHVHQGARREGASFWAGCGAVRRSAFLRVGGFDAVRYPRPMIEDIELGLRLRREGRTRLDPELQVQHLKRWSLASVVATDVLRRAVPWSRLILASGELPDDLNLRRSQRAAAALAPLVLLGLGAAPALALAGAATAAAAAALPALASLLLQRDLVRFFARRRGPAFALGGWLFHQVHLSYSAAVFALCLAEHRLRGPRGARP